MRLIGGFQNLDGRAALALFATPVLACIWATSSQQSQAPEAKACAIETATPDNRRTSHPPAIQYRNGEVKWTPGPRALSAEWIWLKVREARMIAERSDDKTLELPPVLAHVASDPDWAQALASERAILQARRATHYGFERELGKRLIEIRREHDALKGLADGRKRERDLLRRELDGIAYLHKKGLATTGRLVSLQRDMERLKSDEAQLQIDARRVLSRAGEVELDMLRRNAERQIEIADGLRMIETRLAEIEDMRGNAAAPSDVSHTSPANNDSLILADTGGGPCAQGE